MKYILVIGQPGTGKSYAIQQMQNCHKIAPTNPSARLIGGQTIYKFTGSSICNLKSNGVKFNLPTVVIDEVFLFNKYQMSVILDCMSDDTKLIMYGDPYQIKQISDGQDYFYDAFLDKGISLDEIEVQKLTKYYRAQDERLIKVLDNYRTSLESEFPISSFQQISFLESIKKVINSGYTILVGTHAKRNKIQNSIDKYFKKTSCGVVPCSDGRYWRLRQRVYVVNDKGTIQQQDYISQLKPQIKLESSGIVSTRYENGVKYDIISGDVLTINIVQGQTIDEGVILDLESMFEFGSYYTAISRTKRWDNVYILSQPSQKFQIDMNNQFLQ